MAVVTLGRVGIAQRADLAVVGGFVGQIAVFVAVAATGGARIAVAQLAPEHAVQRVQGDGENHRPEHQVEKRAENLVAADHQNGDKPGADQHVQ